MIRKITTIVMMTVASLSIQAGVKVTSLDLTTNGNNGSVRIKTEGRSQELPDIKVTGKTIEVVIPEAVSFNSISKNVKGAQLTANVLNGKAIIKAVLPYEISNKGVNLDFKNNMIEVVFPRGVVAKNSNPTGTSDKPKAAPKTENKVLAKVEKKAEKSVAKETLNEDYLNKLMKEENQKTAGTSAAKDEVNVKQAAIAKTAAPEAPKNKEDFSFASYAVKFTVFLALVLGLFYGIVQLLKKGVFNRGKLGFLNNSQMIQVLSTTYVGPKRSLMVVKAHKQIFLVSSSENGIQFLSEMTDTTGLIKEGEKIVTGTNFDLNLGTAEDTTGETAFKIKENINESTPIPEEKGIQSLSAKDIVKFSDELKKKAKKLKPIEFN